MVSAVSMAAFIMRCETILQNLVSSGFRLDWAIVANSRNGSLAVSLSSSAGPYRTSILLFILQSSYAVF